MNTTDDTNAARRGSGSNDLLGQASEARPLMERLRQERRPTRWTRGVDTDYPVAWEPDPLCQEAATEIGRLRAELQKRHERQHEAEALAGHYLVQRDDARDALELAHTFINAAAGEGLVLDGVDAADLYVAAFPDRYAATIASIEGPNDQFSGGPAGPSHATGRP